ncbi:snake venom C-type Lectin precursor [Bothrops jararaca]|uniref:Snake venom C-type Lectin n=1 Tax=Bothrops jararaca TaxID=8724 RepID=A0A8T1N2Z0_BOTJA|nr:snake venom C-type Lectin precursor [Bothrops jararaca]
MGRFIFVSFGLLVVFLSLSGTAADCPSDWSSHEGHCYRVFTEPKNWADAEKFCTQQQTGGHLVSFQSSKEADFVLKLAQQSIDYGIFWMGLSNLWNQCSSKWSDGSSVSYENVVGRTVKKCFALEKEQEFFVWINIYCGQQNPFVCKSPPP